MNKHVVIKHAAAKCLILLLPNIPVTSKNERVPKTVLRINLAIACR